MTVPLSTACGGEGRGEGANQDHPDQTMKSFAFIRVYSRFNKTKL